jgi:hypothetical protein
MPMPISWSIVAVSGKMFWIVIRSARRGFCDRHPGLGEGHVGARCAVGVGEAVAEDEPMGRIGLDDLPVAARG